MKTWHVYDPMLSEDNLLSAGVIVHAATRGQAKTAYLKRYRGEFCRLVAKRIDLS